MPNLVQRITLSNFQPKALVISFGVTCAADECLPLNNLEIFANIHFTFRCFQGLSHNASVSLALFRVGQENP